KPCPFSRQEINAARTAAHKARAHLRKVLLPDPRSPGCNESERHVCELIRAAHRALCDFFGRRNRDPRWQRNRRQWGALSPEDRWAAFERSLDELDDWRRDVRMALSDATLTSNVRGALTELIGAVRLPPTRRVKRDPLYELFNDPKWDERRGAAR